MIIILQEAKKSKVRDGKSDGAHGKEPDMKDERRKAERTRESIRRMREAEEHNRKSEAEWAAHQQKKAEETDERRNGGKDE